MKLRQEKMAFSIKEAAVLLGLSYCSVWRMVRRGKLRVVGDLRTKLVPRAELERYLSNYASM